MIYNFDKIYDRTKTDAEKYSSREKYFGNENALPFWVADMDFATPDFITEALKERISHPLYGYTSNSDKLYESIIWWLRNEHNYNLLKESILFSPSVVTSINSAVDAFTKKGESIAMFSPVYGPFFSIPKKHKRKVVDVPLILKDNRYEIDFESFENLVIEKEIKLLLLSSPHTPGGRVWTRDELKKIVRICTENSVKIFSDEIHSDIIYSPNRHTPILSINGAEDITVTAHSIGKTFNCSGLKASFIIAPNIRLKRKINNSLLKSHSEDINLLGKVAIESALSPNGVDFKRELLDYLTINRDFVCDTINSSKPKITAMVPEASFLVWLDFRETGYSHKEITQKLIFDANLALSGGDFFGLAGEGFFRINIAHPKSVLADAIERIIKIF